MDVPPNRYDDLVTRGFGRSCLRVFRVERPQALLLHSDCTLVDTRCPCKYNFPGAPYCEDTREPGRHKPYRTIYHKDIGVRLISEDRVRLCHPSAKIVTLGVSISVVSAFLELLHYQLRSTDCLVINFCGSILIDVATI
jgi:hypothetical protein